MAELIVSQFVSLNGVIEAPGGEPTHPHSGWTFESHYDDDHYPYKLEEAEEAGSLLLGRTTYEGFSAAWPERDGPFPDPAEMRKLRLQRAITYDSGVALVIYEPAES